MQRPGAGRSGRADGDYRAEPRVHGRGVSGEFGSEKMLNKKCQNAISQKKVSKKSKIVKHFPQICQKFRSPEKSVK